MSSGFSLPQLSCVENLHFFYGACQPGPSSCASSFSEGGADGESPFRKSGAAKSSSREIGKNGLIFITYAGALRAPARMGDVSGRGGGHCQRVSNRVCGLSRRLLRHCGPDQPQKSLSRVHVRRRNLQVSKLFFPAFQLIPVQGALAPILAF